MVSFYGSTSKEHSLHSSCFPAAVCEISGHVHTRTVSQLAFLCTVSFFFVFWTLPFFNLVIFTTVSRCDNKPALFGKDRSIIGQDRLGGTCSINYWQRPVVDLQLAAHVFIVICFIQSPATFFHHQKTTLVLWWDVWRRWQRLARRLTFGQCYIFRNVCGYGSLFDAKIHRSTKLHPGGFGSELGPPLCQGLTTRTSWLVGIHVSARSKPAGFRFSLKQCWCETYTGLVFFVRKKKANVDTVSL